jgi:uncharacterized protein YkwD
MKSIKFFMSTLAAVLSIGVVAPAFARPASAPPQNNGYTKGYSTGYGYGNGYGSNNNGYKTSRAHFDQELEAKVLELVNDIRYRKGLGELRSDNRAEKSSRIVAKEAGLEGGFSWIDRNLFDRLTDQGLDLSYRVYGETRAIIQEEDACDTDTDLLARQIVKSWMRNAKFSKVLFNDEVSYAGVAAFVNDNGEVSVVLNAFSPERRPVIVQPQYPQYPQSYPQPQPQPKGCGGY